MKLQLKLLYWKLLYSLLLLSWPHSVLSCIEFAWKFWASFFFLFFFYHRQMEDAVPECLSSDGATRGSLHRSDDDLSPPPSPSSRAELLPCSQLSSVQPPPLRHLGTAHYFSYWGDSSLQCRLNTLQWAGVWTRTDRYCPLVRRNQKFPHSLIHLCWIYCTSLIMKTLTLYATGNCFMV